MPNNLCDGEIRKNFRVVANVLVIGLILTILGVVISIFAIINMNTGFHFAPFSFIADPPYLGIVCAVVLVLLVVMAVVLHRIKMKTCSTLELPMI